MKKRFQFVNFPKLFLHFKAFVYLGLPAHTYLRTGFRPQHELTKIITSFVAFTYQPI